MRQIKFRAWDAQSNEWMYAGLKNGVRSFPLTVSNPLCLGLDDRDDAYENTVWSLDNDELVWCQFTGLFDKQGVEIYEGDVVKDGCGIYEIRWSESRLSWIVADDSSDYYDRLSKLGKIEVIGNIYEHGELLKEMR